MKHWLILSVGLAAMLIIPVVGIAAGQDDRFDRFDRARLRAEIRREVREARREHDRVRNEIRREMWRAR